MNAADLLQPGRLFTPLVRPALPLDTADIMELTRTIWDGGDYIPQVWQSWLDDSRGCLAVLTFGGQTLGLCKLTLLSEGSWWLEGLRVHPAWQGQGFAARLFDYLVDFWLHSGDGSLRLATSAKQLAVRHMCDRAGFQKGGEVTWFTAPALEKPGHGFTPTQPDEVPAVLEMLLNSPTLPLTYGLMDLMWSWAAPSLTLVKAVVEAGHAWWWRGGEGLLLLNEDEDEGERFPFISALVCPVEKIGELLTSYRSLAAVLGFRQAVWMAPLSPELAPVLERAGFARDWDSALLLYERTKPAEDSSI